MFKTLLKKQVLEMFQSYVVNRKTGKARSKGGILFMILLFVVIFGGVGLAIYNLATNLGDVTLGRGFNWLFFSLMALLSIAMGVFGSVFNTYASLYMSKDNEMLTALPIPPHTLLLARVSGVFVASLMYSAWVWIPTIFAYWSKTRIQVGSVISPIVIMFILALFVTVLSCLLGWVVAWAATKVKGRSFVTVFVTLLVMGLYYIVYFKFINSIKEMMKHVGEYGKTIKSWFHYIFYLGKASDGDFFAMGIVVAITVVLVVICIALMAKSFHKLSVKEGRTIKKVTKEVNYSQVSQRSALQKREYKHFTESPTWMLNGGLGLLLMPIGAVVLLIKEDAVYGAIEPMLASLPNIAKAMPMFAFALLASVICMNAITASSVSLEGKSIWIIQSLPVSPSEVLKAKMRMDVELSIVPVLVLTTACAYVFRFKVWDSILLLCATAIFVDLKAVVGLFMDVMHANLAWTNESIPAKQSMAVVTQIFGGWMLCFGIGFGGYYLVQLIGATASLATACILTGGVCLGVRHLLMTKGARSLATL